MKMERKNTNKIIYGETFTEQAPEPTPAIFDVLAQYIIAEDGIKKDELRESLNDVYKMFASLDSQFIYALNKLEKDFVINRDESLFLSILVTASANLDPDLSELRQALIDRTIESIDKSRLEKDIFMLNKNISNRLLEVVLKIKDGKPNI